MNALNHGLTRMFDRLLAPLEHFGFAFALVVTSAVFGILALIAFKHLSSQRRIKAAKDKIKAHLIEIRIYQDDLAIVGRAIGKVLLRNFQYLALNFGPFIPLSIPFVLVIAQLAVRYGFDPIRVHGPDEQVMPGRGTLIEVELARERAADIAGLEIQLPPGVRALSPLVRVASEGRAFQEVVATAPLSGAIGFVLADGTRASKQMSAGFADGPLQPERAQGVWSALLWPAEDNLASGSPFRSVRIEYPERHLAFLPDGPAGILLGFLLVSMAAGLLVLKPLKIQI
ncbi:MAG TPA: hypothetical protein VGR31_05615 [Planctomycetota bacterium]|jgi:hypothetical protein|nr:hypothetical protein [Planctomycetota bacterium]